MMKYGDDFGYWFSGFVDGEGSFIGWARDLYNGRGKRFHGLNVHFALGLRADDLPVLEYVKSTLGVGEIYLHDEKKKKHPQMMYKIGHRRELLDVILPHFDVYPLQSKKRYDYTIWREMVITYRYRSNEPFTDAMWERVCNLAVLLSG